MLLLWPVGSGEEVFVELTFGFGDDCRCRQITRDINRRAAHFEQVIHTEIDANPFQRHLT